ELFDSVSLDRMSDAELAVREAATEIPAEVCARFDTADKLSDEDRKTIIAIARQALVPFQPEPETTSKLKSEPKAKPGGESKPDVPSDTKPNPETEGEKMS
ncbi:MAG: hypothetical protein NUV75_10080, partial [Gallionella sp.]|nr:hypothetical protein [Gallionella sp.]